MPVLGEMVSASTLAYGGTPSIEQGQACLELFHSIDSVDSVKLARLVGRLRQERTPILLQVNVGRAD